MADTAKKKSKTTEKGSSAKKEVKKELVRHDDGTIELNITIPASEVEKEREKVENTFAEKVNLKGFRKGKAPKELAKKNLSKEAVNEELLKRVVTEGYRKALEKYEIQPVITPEIHIEAFEEGKDVSFTAETAEEPKVELGDYKKAIQGINAKSKIAIPGKEEQKPSIDTLITAGIAKAKIQTPRILIEKEVSRLLSQLLDEIKMLGMTLDSYLESKGISGEQLRDEYRSRAERDIKLEFFLRAVAESEKITVNDQDITEAISKIEDKNQREEIMKNPYLVASIIRQQKTIDFLTKI